MSIGLFIGAIKSEHRTTSSHVLTFYCPNEKLENDTCISSVFLITENEKSTPPVPGDMVD